jgi:hypothetical protein
MGGRDVSWVGVMDHASTFADDDSQILHTFSSN